MNERTRNRAFHIHSVKKPRHGNFNHRAHGDVHQKDNQRQRNYKPYFKFLFSVACAFVFCAFFDGIAFGGNRSSDFFGQVDIRSYAHRARQQIYGNGFNSVDFFYAPFHSRRAGGASHTSYGIFFNHFISFSSPDDLAAFSFYTLRQSALT